MRGNLEGWYKTRGNSLWLPMGGNHRELPLQNDMAHRAFRRGGPLCLPQAPVPAPIGGRPQGSPE